MLFHYSYMLSPSLSLSLSLRGVHTFTVYVTAGNQTIFIKELTASELFTADAGNVGIRSRSEGSET